MSDPGKEDAKKICKQMCCLFSECTFERKVETRFGERTVTSSRRWKGCADGITNSLTRLILAGGLVFAACKLCVSIKPCMEHESAVLECNNRLQSQINQISAAVAVLSSEVERFEAAARECDECSRQLSAATTGMCRETTDVFLNPYRLIWGPVRLRSCE